MATSPVTPWPRWLGTAAVTALVELITFAGTLGPPQRSYARDLDALAWTLLAVAAGTVALARRWPVPAFAIALAATTAYFALGYHTDSPFFLGLVVTSYLSGGAGARVRVAVLAVATVVVIGAAALVGASRDPGTAPATASIVVVAIAIGQFVAEARARNIERDQQGREDETRRRIAEERLRIARELHDVVSHGIAMINVQANAGLHVGAERPDQALAALAVIKEASHDALGDLRTILGLLRQGDGSDPLAPSGRIAEVASLVENVRRSGADVSLVTSGDLTSISPAVDVAVYRIVQEALTNVIRHAPGASARVRIARTDAALDVLVEDEGRSDRPPGARGAGQGLVGMRERVNALGGTLEAGPVSSGGFAVRAAIPLSRV